jgi:hypothetical protein
VRLGTTGNTVWNYVRLGTTGNTGWNYVRLGTTGNTGWNYVRLGTTGNTGWKCRLLYYKTHKFECGFTYYMEYILELHGPPYYKEHWMDLSRLL